MVKVSPSLLVRSTSRLCKRRENEPLNEFLGRMTHLYMDNKDIDEVVSKQKTRSHLFLTKGDALIFCKSLEVLYLYENHLTEFPELPLSPNLTHLYLQHNDITEIRHLEKLVNLEKLANKISVLEGLESQEKLSDLKVDHQRLPPGEGMILDDLSLKTLQARSNISGSGVNSLIGLEYFDNLERLDVESNQLADANEVLSVLTTMGHLKELNISHNPIMNEPRIRDRIIVAIGSLEFLNGKEISNSNRQFVTSWSAYKTNSEHDNQKH
ncbi:unnamed protein product [Mesocestoides corti]|uniref:Dynein assembly factor 1, axonemal homolog n=1 Tax=Mesocestoides corti TaxID=53468 RepID=A0A0R3U5A6_MESCO|nr:unnamed protein product [Mesocestoides corti]